MSKQFADTYLTKDGKRAEGWGGPASQSRPTSAQMANRKIAVPRGVRRGGAARPRPGLGATSASMQQQQQSLPNLGQASPSISGGFTFGQQSNTVAPNQTSQSFPPFGNSSANTDNNNTGANNFSFTAPSTAFSFNVTPANNPFSNPNVTTSMPSQTSGFQGSIFSLEATPDVSHNDATAQTTPLFSQPVQDTSDPSHSSSDPACNATASTFTWPSAQQQTSQISNPFQQSLSATRQPPLFSQSSNAASTVKDSSSSIFANLQSPSNQNDESSTSKQNYDIFSHLKHPGSTQSPASENPFAASIAKFQEDQKTKPANVFSSVNQSANQPPLNPFNPYPKLTNEPERNSPAADSMKPSPDGTPRKPGGNQVSDPEAYGKSVDRTSSPVSNDTASLFDRVTRPDAESPADTSHKVFQSAASRTSGPSSFGKDPQSEPSAKLSPTLDGASTADITKETQSGATSAAKKPHSGQAGDWQFAKARQGVESAANLQGSSFQSDTFPKAESTTSSGDSSNTRPEIDYTKPHNEASTPGLDLFYRPSMPPIQHGDRRRLTIAWRLHALNEGMIDYLEQYYEGADINLLKDFWQYKVGAIFLAGEGPVELLPGRKRSASESTPSDVHQPKRAKLVPSSISGLLSSEEQSASHEETIANSQQAQVLQPWPSTKSKRKADEDPPDGDMSTNGLSAKRVRVTEESPLKSQTSNLFSTILDSKQEDRSQKGDVAGATPDFSVSTTQASGLFAPHAGSGASSERSQASIVSPVKTSASPSSHPNNSGSFPNPFAVMASPARQPTNDNVDSVPEPDSAGSQALKLPQSGNAPPGGWIAQSGQIAQQDEEKASEMRKEDDHDSDEEDKAAWEQRDSEAQRRRKQEIAEATKPEKNFISDLGTLSSAPESRNESPLTVTRQPKPRSIFDTTHPAFGQSSPQNIFDHLAKESHDGGGSKHGDADDDHKGGHDGEEEEAEQLRSPTKTNMFGDLAAPAPCIGRSLFDRVSKPIDDMSQSASDVPSNAGSQTGDHTWKVDSPIKFGPVTSSPPDPSVNIESPSPSKNPFGGLFGASNMSAGSDRTPKAGSGISSNLPLSAPSGVVGFGFTPVEPNARNLTAPSNESSRAPSPGLTTGDSAAESTADGVDESGEQHSQLDLMSGRAGEEDEDVVYEVRAKATSMDSQAKEFVSRGVGPLRILKHRTTGQPRALLRADPGGRIALNSGLMKQGKYQGVGANTISGPFADSKGVVGAWRLRVKTANEATELLQALEQNTPSGE